jgi:hypothetical protein
MSMVVGALAFAASAPAAAAVLAQNPAYSPWAALSTFAWKSSSTALCGSNSAANSTQQNNRPGCVLPKGDAAPIAASAGEAVIAPAAATAAGIGTLPLLVGLATLAGLAALALGSSGGSGSDAIGGRPVSPR